MEDRTGRLLQTVPIMIPVDLMLFCKFSSKTEETCTVILEP